MKIRFSLLLTLLLPISVACKTVDDKAPVEFHQAQQAISEAKSADVDDLMPSAYEAAQRKFSRSVELLSESNQKQVANETAQADGSRQEAIKLAVDARLIANNARKIVEDMHAFDENLGPYYSQDERNAQVVALQTELDQVRTSYARMASVPQNTESVVMEVPEDFRVAKPMAYFGLVRSSQREEVVFIEDFAILS